MPQDTSSTVRGIAVKLLSYGVTVAAVGAVFVGPAAAAGPAVMQTSVTNLEMIEFLARVHKLLRNIAYLLGPIVLLHGITLWALGSKNSSRSQRGFQAMVGGAVLFALSLALDIVLQLAAFIGDV